MRFVFYILILFIFSSCASNSENERLNSFKDKCPISSGFDYPVGWPTASGYYNAQEFTVNNHLGEDWNGLGGGDTDLGDDVMTTSSGIVVFAKDVKGGWGNVIRILHQWKDGNEIIWYESVYAHLDEILVNEGEIVKRGQKIGTIGTAHGKYKAHLHFEIRDKIGMELGGGYSKNTEGFVHPTQFILGHRKTTI